MKSISIEDVIFELKDIEIFKIPDTKTRITTVQNYFFPRLEILLKQSLKLVQEIYKVNPYERMTFVYYPSNRKTARQNRDFHFVHIGISGKRRTDRDLKFNRQDGKPFHLHPTYLTYNIHFDGSIRVEFLPFRQNVSTEFIVAVGELYKENFAALSPIFGFHQITHDRNSNFIDMKDAFVGGKEDVNFNFFYSPKYYFPTNVDRGLCHLMLSFVALYPLLDSFNSLGEGESPKLVEMIARLKEWYLSEEECNEDEPLFNGSNKEQMNLPELGSYNFVRAGIWWSVLARDSWTCCSCGRSSKEEGITLEVDHIIPRSKGGSNDIVNLQTLCKKCNIGKSNRDSTDLKRKL